MAVTLEGWDKASWHAYTLQTLSRISPKRSLETWQESVCRAVPLTKPPGAPVVPPGDPAPFWGSSASNSTQPQRDATQRGHFAWAWASVMQALALAEAPAPHRKSTSYPPHQMCCSPLRPNMPHLWDKTTFISFPRIIHWSQEGSS